MRLSYLLSALSLVLATPASAASLMLDFDNVGDYNPIGNFYGMQGIAFSDDALAVTNLAGGGLSEFENPPSPFTVATFLGDYYNLERSYVNVAAGFDTGFSFFYSSAVAQTVTVFDGLNGTGNALASIPLVPQFDRGCTPGVYCNWTAAGTAFSGIARSVDFTLFNGATGAAALDNLTFGSATPGVVPEPNTWTMMLAGFAMIGVGLRRRWRMDFKIA